MRPRAILFVVFACIAVGASAQRLAEEATRRVERATAEQVAAGLAAAGEDWAQATTDGLIVTLTGAAPDEADRLRAVEILRRIVDPRRVRDATTLADRPPLAAPPFALELLRDAEDVSLIGLAPVGSGRAAIADALAEKGLDATLSDMLESVKHPAPEGWDAALAFGLAALGDLPQSKISVTPGHVAVQALTETEAARRTIEANLRAASPKGLALDLAITAPRPVIAPFAASFALAGGVPRLTSCAAETPQDAAAIAAAAGRPASECAIGLGAPSPDWAEAVVAGIAAVRDLGGGAFTISDLGATLTASGATAGDRLDAVAEALQAALPATVSLAVRAPEPAASGGPKAVAGAPRFTATLRADGAVTLSGWVQDAVSRDAVAGYAAALFGHDRVTDDTRVDAGLPAGWPVRVLAGIEALALLNEGELDVTGTAVSLRGWSEAAGGAARAEAILKARGISPAAVALNFDAVAAAAEAEADAIEADPVGACSAGVAEIQRSGTIAFEPGSATLEESGFAVIAAMARVMADCPPLDFEIAGHTDSQGRDESNQSLSEARALAVKAALEAMNLPHMRFFARGYGADRPVAENLTEVGRSRNRRIEFTLIADAARGDAIGSPGPETPFGPR